MANSTSLLSVISKSTQGVRGRRAGRRGRDCRGRKESHRRTRQSCRRVGGTKARTAMLSTEARESEAAERRRSEGRARMSKEHPRQAHKWEERGQAGESAGPLARGRLPSHLDWGRPREKEAEKAARERFPRFRAVPVLSRGQGEEEGRMAASFVPTCEEGERGKGARESARQWLRLGVRLPGWQAWLSPPKPPEKEPRVPAAAARLWPGSCPAS